MYLSVKLKGQSRQIALSVTEWDVVRKRKVSCDNLSRPLPILSINQWTSSNIFERFLLCENLLLLGFAVLQYCLL